VFWVGIYKLQHMFRALIAFVILLFFSIQSVGVISFTDTNLNSIASTATPCDSEENESQNGPSTQIYEEVVTASEGPGELKQETISAYLPKSGSTLTPVSGRALIRPPEA